MNSNILSNKRKLLDARSYRAAFSLPQLCEKRGNFSKVSAADISVKDMSVTMISTSAKKIDRIKADDLALTHDKNAPLNRGVLVESGPTYSSPKAGNQDLCEDSNEFQREHCFQSSPDVDDAKLSMEEDMGRLEESNCHGISKDDLGIKDNVVGMKNDGSNACVICRCLQAELSCEGKGCRRRYHLSCLNLPLQTIPPGAWLCFCCLKKLTEHGMYSVTQGIDSVWDFRVDLQNGKLYFVKYKGLAHVHNRWITGSQLFTEAPRILELFNSRHQKEKVNIWNKEWIEPHRLLLRRKLLPQNIADEFFDRVGDKSPKCYHAWFVKWKGLGYEDATWEMESLPCLGTPSGLKLIKEYENRVAKTLDSSKTNKVIKLRQDAYHKMSSFPDDYPAELDNDHLNCVNKLGEFWHKSRNAVLIDKQERATKSILFIMSLLHHSCHPFLIITTRDSLPFWETKFNDVAPSINMVVYSGLKDVRNMIQTLEFYNEYGCIMFQVLLSHSEAVLEDLETLKGICWEGILVDDCENVRISEHFKQLNYLSTNFKVLLLGGQLKDSTEEYTNVLSFLGCDLEKIPASLNCHSKDSVLLFKEKLASYIAYEHKESCSRFLEYWVPVHLTAVQLELYSAMLLLKSSSLCSSSTDDSADALRDVLVSARMCCNHPHLMGGSLESTLMKNLAASENLNVGISVSGKLQLLDKVLHEFRSQGLRVVILFQVIASGKPSLGDILDDFLAKRFGVDSFEHVDNGLTRLKKIAAMTNFNDKEKGRFVFLIDHRACLPSIKLSSVDAVIIYNSDWNPLNDLRVLQKITIKTEKVHTPVFRLYSSLTVEEKFLALAKQDAILECNIANISWTKLHCLLSWGAFDLFQQLDDFHKCDHLSGHSSPTEKLLDFTVSELVSVLHNNDKSDNPINFSSLVKAYQSGASYSRHIILASEARGISSVDKDPASFWSNLLNQKSPQWRYLCDPSQNSQSKTPLSDAALKSLEPEHEEPRKRRKLCSSSVEDSNNSQSWQQEETRETAETVVRMMSVNLKEKTATGSGISPLSAATSVNKSDVHEAESEEQLSVTQKSIHSKLKPELSTLCEKLRLPVDVMAKAQEFLEYIVRNHCIGHGSETTLQALKIALCWRAASFLLYDIDRGETLARAKKYLNYSCDEKDASRIYHKLKMLKKIFSAAKVSACGETESKSTENLSHLSQIESPVGCSPVTKSTSSSHQREISCFETVSIENLKVMQSESTPALDAPLEVNSLKDEVIRKQIELVNIACHRRMSDLLRKQAEERADLIMYKKKEELKLKDAHEKDLAIINSLHTDSVAASDRISLLNHEFSEKIERFTRHFESQFQKLEDSLLISREKEKQLKLLWLEAAATRGTLSLSFDDIPLSDSGFTYEEFSCVAERFDDHGNMVQTKEFWSHKQPSARHQIGSSEPRTSNMIISDDLGSISSEFADGRPLQTINSDPGFSHMNEGGTLQNQIIMDLPSTTTAQTKSGILRGTEVAEDASGRPTNLLTQESTGITEDADSRPINSAMPENIGTQHQSSVCNYQKRNDQGSCQQSNTQGRGGGDGGNTFLVSQAICNQAEHLAQAELLAQAEEHERPQEHAGLGEGSSTIPHCNLPLVSVDGALQTNVLMQEPVETSIELVHNNTTAVMPLVEKNSQRRLPSVEILTTQSSRSSQHIDLILQAEEHDRPQEYGGVGDGSSTTVQGSLPSNSVGTALRTNALMQELVETPLTEPVYDTTAVSVSPQRGIVMPLAEQNSERTEIITAPSEPDEPMQESIVSSEPVAHPVPENAEIITAPPSGAVDLLMQEAIFSSEPVVHPVQHNVNEVPQRTNVEDAGGSANRVESFCSFQLFPLAPLPPHQVTQSEPLIIELGKIKNQENVISKMHDDMKLRLNSEREQEIEKINRKYDNLLYDTEKQFLQSKKILETIYNKVLMNQILAEEFKGKFAGVKEGSSSQGQQPSLPQQLVQQLHPENQRPTSGPPSLPATPHATTPSSATRSLPTSRFRPPCSVALSFPSSSTAWLSTAAYPSNFTRPQFSSSAPRIGGQFGGGPRAPAPHLQRFRASSTSATSQNTFPRMTAVPLQQHEAGFAATVGHAAPLLSTQRIPASGVGQQVVYGTTTVSTVDLPLYMRNYQEARNFPNVTQLNEIRPMIDDRSNLAWIAGTSQSPSSTSNRQPAADILGLSDDE